MTAAILAWRLQTCFFDLAVRMEDRRLAMTMAGERKNLTGRPPSAAHTADAAKPFPGRDATGSIDSVRWRA